MLKFRKNCETISETVKCLRDMCRNSGDFVEIAESVEIVFMKTSKKIALELNFWKTIVKMLKFLYDRFFCKIGAECVENMDKNI